MPPAGLVAMVCWVPFLVNLAAFRRGEGMRLQQGGGGGYWQPWISRMHASMCAHVTNERGGDSEQGPWEQVTGCFK